MAWRGHLVPRHRQRECEPLNLRDLGMGGVFCTPGMFCAHRPSQTLKRPSTSLRTVSPSNGKNSKTKNQEAGLDLAAKRLPSALLRAMIRSNGRRRKSDPPMAQIRGNAETQKR